MNRYCYQFYPAPDTPELSSIAPKVRLQFWEVTLLFQPILKYLAWVKKFRLVIGAICPRLTPIPPQIATSIILLEFTRVYRICGSLFQSTVYSRSTYRVVAPLVSFQRILPPILSFIIKWMILEWFLYWLYFAASVAIISSPYRAFAFPNEHKNINKRKMLFIAGYSIISKNYFYDNIN